MMDNGPNTSGHETRGRSRTGLADGLMRHAPGTGEYAAIAGDLIVGDLIIGGLLKDHVTAALSDVASTADITVDADV